MTVPIVALLSYYGERLLYLKFGTAPYVDMLKRSIPMSKILLTGDSHASVSKATILCTEGHLCEACPKEKCPYVDDRAIEALGDSMPW